MEADLLIVHAGQLLTLAGSGPEAGPRAGPALDHLGIIRDGAVAIADGLIIQVGPTADVLDAAPRAATVLDAAGRTVLPGFVDAHTHLLFAGSRVEDFELRLRGATYQEIAAGGGGILHTVTQTRLMSEGALVEVGLARLSRMLAHGTTTVEAKSGYGLSTEEELKLLRALHRLNTRHQVDVVPTFLGAHAVPPESADSEGYVRLVIEEMLPAVADEDLAEFCDVFCERGAFTAAQSRAVLEAGAEYGLGPKIHADEFSDSGGARLAAEVGAISADHLEYAADDGLRAMAEAGTMAVLLPGTAFFLGLPAPPVRRMIDLGVAVALATDFNPGSSPTYSMPMVIALAVLRVGLHPGEAIAAATINAAHAIGMAEEVGSLEAGKVADLVILAATDYRALAMHFGVNLVDEVYKRGRRVYSGRAGVIDA